MMTQQYSITDLASEFSVTARTLRFYEEKALLNPRRIGQTRWYSAADRARLKLILRGKRLGLTLQESSDIIQMYDPCSDNEQQLLVLIDKIQLKRAALEKQRQDLDEMIDELDTWLARYQSELSDKRIGKTGAQSS